MKIFRPLPTTSDDFGRLPTTQLNRLPPTHFLRKNGKKQEKSKKNSARRASQSRAGKKMEPGLRGGPADFGGRRRIFVYHSHKMAHVHSDAMKGEIVLKIDVCWWTICVAVLQWIIFLKLFGVVKISQPIKLFKLTREVVSNLRGYRIYVENCASFDSDSLK